MAKTKEEIKEMVRCYQYQRYMTLIDRLTNEVKPDQDLFTMNSHLIMIRNFVDTTSAECSYIEDTNRRIV